MDKNEIKKRLEDIKKIKSSLDKKDNLPSTPAKTIVKNKNKVINQNYQEGISVIIPTYKGEGVIRKCLQSLKDQSLSRDLFEVIIVINGQKDSTEDIINEYIKIKKMSNIHVLKNEKPSASLARNKGISYAAREYTVFLDDDDFLSTNFLESMYYHSNSESVTISQIVDIDDNGKKNKSNAINKQILDLEGKTISDLKKLSMVLTINACKCIPTGYLKGLQFSPDLKSGEDIVFFVELFIKNDLNITTLPAVDNAIYYRQLRENSVSRQLMTFDFYVKQRLEVISRLNNLLNITDNIEKETFIRQKINAQSAFINKYIKANTMERELVINEVKKYELAYIPYTIINKGLADRLIISYCFPPYMDTSGNVMAKRIRNMKQVVDVLYNKMDRVREKDNDLNLLVNDVIEDRIEVPSYSSFSNWKAIEEFCNKGLQVLDEKNYKEIYSRAMWPASHFFSYKYKEKNPNVKWIAEFSDPILYDVNGKERYSKIEDMTMIKKVNNYLKKKFNISSIKSDNLYLWCELLPYIYAEKLVFTNYNQYKYMRSYFPIKAIRKLIEEKAEISQHPTLPKDYYYKTKSYYKLDERKINIAYFGAFYSTRNLNELFEGLKNVDYFTRQNLKLHIFTSNPADLKKELHGSVVEEYIQVNSYVSFVEFLNLTTKFDCLVVNDAKTFETKSINPYLPSKLSDYRGSGNKVWALYEKGSVLSDMNVDYHSELNNVDEATQTFKDIVDDKICGGENRAELIMTN